ncbi:MAG: CHASE2 domain-containing protein [Candidatus Omnitrophica bacterium]|nr:CHASE2 domain-containing protein [Candidatus Omnitrophota bacterium]
MALFKKSLSSFALFLGTLGAVSFYIAFLSHTTVFESLRMRSVDSLYRWRAGHAQNSQALSQIVVIGADDDSFHKINRRWPWPRPVHAVFLDKLEALGPKVVALDFAYIGRSEGERVDEWLAEAIGKNRNVILASYFTEGGKHLLPLDRFHEKALGLGFANKIEDADDVNRRASFQVPLEGGREKVPSLSLAAVSAFAGKEIGIPPNRGWQSYRYSPQKFSYIPFWKVVAGKADEGLVRGRIAVVGAVSPSTHDIHPTPLGPMAGVYIHANEAASLLEGDFVRSGFLDHEWIFLLMLAAFFFAIFSRMDLLKGFLVLLALGFLLVALSGFLFTRMNVLIEPFSPVWVLAFVYGVCLLRRSLSAYLENRALQRQVVMDHLTGLYGYKYLSLRLGREFQNSSAEFCYVMVDIDKFKDVNDSHGHETGNAVIVGVAKILKNGVRASDVAARYGGDEFCLILLNCGRPAAEQTMEKIRKSVENASFKSEYGDFHVTVSIGVACRKTVDAKTAQDLITFADKALYQAKLGGRNKICVY